jgi:hypothetical protein
VREREKNNYDGKLHECIDLFNHHTRIIIKIKNNKKVVAPYECIKTQEKNFKWQNGERKR